MTTSTLKIGTWNVNSLRVRLPQLQQWLEGSPVDVIGLQELKLEDKDFPAEALAAAGWQAVWSGQKTYNGVALLARQPLGLQRRERRTVFAHRSLALARRLRNTRNRLAPSILGPPPRWRRPPRARKATIPRARDH